MGAGRGRRRASRHALSCGHGCTSFSLHSIHLHDLHLHSLRLWAVLEHHLIHARVIPAQRGRRGQCSAVQCGPMNTQSTARLPHRPTTARHWHAGGRRSQARPAMATHPVARRRRRHSLAPHCLSQALHRLCRAVGAGVGSRPGVHIKGVERLGDPGVLDKAAARLLARIDVEAQAEQVESGGRWRVGGGGGQRRRRSQSTLRRIPDACKILTAAHTQGGTPHLCRRGEQRTAPALREAPSVPQLA